jgi:hypothetical protein
MTALLILALSFVGNFATEIPFIKRLLDSWELKHRLNLGAADDDPMVVHLKRNLKLI